MGHYSKLAVLAVRSMGLVIVLYSVPIILFGIVRVASGAGTASDGGTSSASALFAWIAYGFAGLLLLALARPLGRIAARGLDAPAPAAPAA
jgi:hypothetical protein